MFEPLPLDVSPVPIMLELFAFPAVIFGVIVLLIWLVVRIIRKLSDSRKETAYNRYKAENEEDDHTEEDK